MIIYNVTTKVATDVHLQWLQWMQEEHIPAVLSTGLFSDSRICRLLEQDDSEGPTYVTQFFTDSLEHYQTFQAVQANTLRQRGYDLFGDRFIAFHTVMESI
ncbi:DUF4286 family protein [Chitinophaga flava]|uniref:DUF4286 domain-containing protein n=1 Tax=Chitinophaga flava TaxID=2259036 RepID=A0A365Y4W6_9BACT|nr:DUF4286 family protein [Chitinophaga flava]RBL93632.1 DUF4286 domain-containing protein [Chitinophaga flava]